MLQHAVKRPHRPENVAVMFWHSLACGDTCSAEYDEQCLPKSASASLVLAHSLEPVVVVFRLWWSLHHCLHIRWLM